MSWDEVRQVGGFELRTRLRDLRSAHQERTVPREVHGPFEAAPHEVLPDGIRAWSTWDRLEVDPAVLALVDRPEEVGQDVLRQLVDHRVWLEG